MKSMRRGFTLIEILAVLLIAGLLTATVSISLTGAHRVLQMQDVVDRWGNYDQLTRQQAERFGRPLQLVTRLDLAQVQRVDAEKQEPRGAALDLPVGYRIEQVRLPDRKVTSGELTIPYAIHGQSPTYAVLLAGPKTQQQWILIVGLSGQVVRLDNEAQVADTFKLVSHGHDAG